MICMSIFYALSLAGTASEPSSLFRRMSSGVVILTRHDWWTMILALWNWRVSNVMLQSLWNYVDEVKYLNHKSWERKIRRHHHSDTRSLLVKGELRRIPPWLRPRNSYVESEMILEVDILASRLADNLVYYPASVSTCSKFPTCKYQTRDRWRRQMKFPKRTGMSRELKVQVLKNPPTS